VETAAMEAEAKMDSRAVEEGLAVMRQSTVKLMYAARLTWENIVVNLHRLEALELQEGSESQNTMQPVSC
jgi:hypothetical protein